MTVSKFLKKYVRKNRAYDIYDINTGEKLYTGLNCGWVKKKYRKLKVIEVSARGINLNLATVILKVKKP